MLLDNRLGFLGNSKLPGFLKLLVARTFSLVFAILVSVISTIASRATLWMAV